MYAKRVIPCLDVKNGRVVKGVSFVNLRDAGDPVECAVAYDKKGADELVLLDITATHEGRGTMLDVVERVAGQVYIPFTVGGGISDTGRIKELLRRGADKVSLNSPAVREPELISRAADKFGSQCIVCAIDARRAEGEDRWQVYINGGRVPTGLDAEEWAVRAVELGGAALSAYLAGEAIPCTAPGSGYAAVCVQGYPLGFGKLTGGTLKNHLPKGLRMR